MNFMWIISICFLHSVTGQETTPAVTVRLRGGLNDREGRVEVLYRGEWGTICDDAWDARDSGVVCRMLGFVGASRPHNGSYFPSGSGKIWLDDVRCAGDEVTIAACQHSGWDGSNCGHAEDAGITCLGERISTTTTTTRRPTTTTGPPTICNDPSSDVRLVDDEGGQPWAGRVQVLYNATWYEVCDDAWGLAEAQVVCAMLCYNPANARAHIGPSFGNITEAILLDNVACTGNEASLLDCPANDPFDHNCQYTEGAGVSCVPDNPSPPPPPDPEIVCENEMITARFPREDDERLRPEHLSLEGRDGCGYTTNIDGAYVSISIPFIGCGSTRQINETDIIYENMLRYEIPSDDDVITRRQTYNISVSCVMGRNDDPDNAVEPGGQTIAPKFGNGHFEVGMYIYRSNRFTEAVQEFPAAVKLGDWVYVALSLTSTDTELKIVVPRCYTTPTADPASEPQYLLIQDKCKVDNSVVFYPINQTMFAYRFRSFKFLDQSDIVYLHCKAYVCGEDEKDARCDRSCGAVNNNNRRKKRDLTQMSNTGGDYEIIFPNHTIFHMEKGPLLFLGPNRSLSTTNGNAPFSTLSTNGHSPGGTVVHTVAPSSSSMTPTVLGGGRENELPFPKNKDGQASAAPSPPTVSSVVSLLPPLLLTFMVWINTVQTIALS